MTLLDAVLEAHHESALRGNCSHHALAMAAFGSGDYFKSIAAGLLTLGGLHAPLVKTYDLLSSPDCLDQVDQALATKQRIAGWGNAFSKGEHDPIWVPVALLLAKESPALALKITAITNRFHERGKDLYPNPSCYTAASALALGIPRAGVGELLIRGRLKAWTEEYCRIQREAPVLA